MKVKKWMLAFAGVVLLPFVAMAEAALPKAAVTQCAPVTLTKADHNYMVWPSGDATVDRPLQIVMNFKAQESLEEAKAGAYGKYKCDFYLSIEGLAETSIVEGYSRKAITADDCYLAGNYGSFGWIVIPTDGLVLEEGISYPVVAAYDANLTYEDICGSVKDFTAAIYVAPAILAANPDFKVSLALKMTDPNDASKVLTIGEPATYTVKDLLMPTATVSTLANEELTFALNFKADEVSPEALEYFGSWYADFELSVNKETVFNANGGANGYLSGQYDEWSENWVNVPFEDVTLAANEPLKIMAYAAKMLGQSGLKLTYRDVYEGVKDFDCGVFFEPDFLTANPDLEVTLELRMYNPANESESYVIGKTYVFTLGEKPTVVIPENVTAPEGVQNNAAVEETPVVLPDEVKTFEISLASVTTEAAETAKVTFNVEPKDAEGVKVAAPSKAITFRLPLPSAWSGFAKVTHEDALLGIYDIQEANGNKFVEITSQAFSEYVVEQSDIVLPPGVTSASFGTDTVTDGTTYYATLQAAVEAVCGTAGATLYCKPGADVGALQHAPVTATLTVYGNGASVSGGAERDFDIGNTDPSGGKDITADMTLTVKDLDGCGAWGAKATTHTVNLVFDGCRNMGKVFITGTTGTLNITIKDASFEGVIKEAVYSNADGAITLSKVDFSNLNKAVNLNHKAAGTQTVAIENCSFTNCGADVAADQIPVRVLSSVEGGKSVLTVSGTTFTGTPEGGADILLDYGVGETTATVSTADTVANVVVEKTDNVGTTTTVPANTQNQSFATVEPVAKIGEKTYSSLQAAIDAVQDGDTITLLVSCAETITFTQTKDVSFVIDGNQQTMTGSINITARAGKDAPSTLTIKNFKFTTDKIAHDFIKSVETNYYPNNITIENCSFTGTADITSEGYAVVAVRLKSANKILIKDCTGSGLHSFLQNTAGWNVNLENVDVTDSLGGFAMGTVQGTTITDCDLDVETMGIRLDAQYNNDAEITDCNVTAFIPVVVRKASVDSSLTFSGTNTMTAENTDGLWCAIGTSEYKENGALPTAPTSKVVVTLKDTGLPAAGLYGNYYVASVNGVTYLTLAEAVAAAQSGDTILLKNGEYELPLFSDKELTFKGESKEGVIINDAPDARAQGWNGSTFHFETLTAKGATANYHGLANGVVAVTYKDCIIKGLRFLYAHDVSFEGCAFTAEGVEHSFWTYGASNVTVSNCSFTYTDRAVNCYSENGADHEVDIAFSECTFTYAGTSDAPAGAVEINSSSVKSIDLSMDACTAPAKGAIWYNSQWDGTQGEKTTVVVDEQPVWPLVAEVNGVKYASFEAALAAAQAGNTIKLLRQVTCSGTTRPQFAGEGVVYVDLNGYIFVSNNRDRVRLSDKILFTGGFGWEVYQYNGMPATNVEFRVFPTLDAAVTYNPSTNNPARIYPYQNVTQAADVTLKAYPAGTSSTICVDPGYEIVWDLNGYAVTQESPSGNPLEACIRGKLTLVDSSDTQTGKWIAGACGVTNPANGWYGNGGPALYVLGEGELVLEGGTISIARNATLDTAGNEIVNSGGLIRVDGGKLNVNGATLQVEDTYGVMAWGGEIEINAGTFDIDPAVSAPVYAVGYYEEVAVKVNSTFAGALCVYGNVTGYKGASATVNVAGVEYATGSGWVVPSVGEGLMAFDGIVLEAGEAVVTTETTITPYATLAEAFTAAQPGDTVTIMSGTYNQGLTVDKAITVVGATDAEGNNLVTFNGTLNVTAEGATVKNINVNNPSGNGGRITAKNVLIEGCSVVGANGFRYCYTTGTVTFKDSVITGQTYGIHFDGSDGGNIVIDNCVITGWTSFAGTITNVAIEDTTFANGNYNQLRFYQNAQMTNVKFNEEMTIDFGKEDVDAAFTGCTVVDSEGNPSTKPLTDVIYKGDIADMGVDVTIDAKPMTVEAKIGEVYYLTLQEALNAAAKGTGEVAVDVLTDIDMTGKTWTPVRVSDPGYPFVTVNGNDKTIKGLTDMLFSGTWAGKSGLVINDLTIADSTIVNDENDAIGTVGVGAFIGYPSASETITLKNCHLKNSTVKGGHWTGGLVGIAGGYSGNDGPVFMTLTFEGCSVTGSTITGKGSAGGIIGHAANDAWTNVIIKDATVSDNTITSTGSSANKAGSVMGTIGAAGQSATAGGETKQGGVAVAATTSGNAVTSAATTITTIYGRQGSSTGMLEVTGGTYEANPIEDNVAYAAPAEGYIIKQNDEGTYGLVETKIEVTDANGNVTYLANLKGFSQSNVTLKLLKDVADYNLNLQKATGVVLDLNGYTFGKQINLMTGSQITIKDSSTEKTGKVVTDANTIWIMNGDLILESGTIETTSTTLAAVYANAAEVIIKDGKIVSAGNAISVGENFIESKGASSVEITGGEIQAEGCGIVNGSYSQDETSVTISGGSITSGNDSISFTTGTVAVSGGTFSTDVSDYCAEGYGVKQNADGTYGVVELPAVSMTVTMNGAGMTIEPSSHTTLSEALKRLDVLGSLITLGGGISLVEITINKDIEDAEIATIKYNTTINGNGKTLTYTGTDRAIDVPNTANGANVTIKDLTVVATSAERGINYNTNGTLTVENVTVTSKMYAINFPTSADNATVSIKDSELTSAIALNIWGSDMEITVTDSELYSVENDPKFSYATIQLNRDGSGNIAEGTTIVVNGGKLSAIDENGNPSIVVSNWTATGEATVSSTTEVIGSVKNAVAMVGGACFYTLQDAIDGVVNEGYTAPIVVIRDIALTETVTVPANATVTLDLNGQTVSMTKAETVTANHEMILNKGNLTIQDAVGGGKLSYQYTGASLGTSYAANTITTEPGSTLTVKSGTIENLTYEGGIIAYAVDGRTNGGLGDVTVNIEGGTITSKRQSIRIFANSTTKTGALNISGGEIIGRMIVQNANANANKAALSITGGTFNANAYKTEVLYVGGSNGATIDMTPVVSGGTFNGVVASTMTEGFISGGVFVTDVSDYCVAGYKAEQNAEGTYGIVVDPAYGKVAKVGDDYYDTLVAAVAAADPGQTVTLLADASGDGIIINKSITIDLNEKTYTIDGTLVGSAGTQSCGFQILSGNTVTIQDGAIVMDEGAVRGHDGLPGNNFVIQNYADLTLKDVAITGNSKTSYVVSINSGTVALTGNTSITAAGDNVAFDVYDYSSAGYAVPAVTVDTIGTIIGRIEVSEAASLAISNGTYTVAIAPEWCAEGFIPRVNGDGTYGVKQGQYLAQIGDKQYESVAAALAAARAEGVTELTITLIGTNTSATEDTFDLAYGTAFDNVTIQQNNGGQPYYIAGIYTGDRTATEGKFILDGVNITSVSNIWFECDVVLKNNAVLTRSDDSKNFVYYGTVTIEPGSKFVSQIDDVMAGEFIVDGGKTDGSYCAEPAYKSIYVDVRSGQTLTLKNGAYALFNAANEIGRLTLNGNAEIADSKLEVFENIVMGENAKLTLDSESFVSTKTVTGSGVITVTVDAFEGATKQIIAADMTGFTGTLDMVNNTECEMVYIADATGLTIMKVVAYVGNVPYATLEEIPENATGIKLLDRAAAVAAAQKVVAQSGDKVVSGGDAYDVATLLGGTFSKVVDATSQTSVLCYNYDFGVSHVQYTWADDVTLGTKVPLVNVTAAIKDADATTARTLDARALVIEVRNDAETVLRTIYVEAPAFTVQGGQVIYIHPVDVSDILTLDATLYFTVRMTDTWSNNVEEEEDVKE